MKVGLSFSLIFVFLLEIVHAQESLTEDRYAKPSPQSEFRLQIKENVQSAGLNESANSPGDDTKLKSVGKGVIFSAIVPGAGQAYANSYIKGFLFLGAEIAAIVLNRRYDSKANDYEDEYEALADMEWDEDAYWDWIAQESGRDRENLVGLRQWERDNFSHFLPNTKNQQYYENVGKYDQFLYGWRDFRDSLGTQYTLEVYRTGFLNGEDLTTISDTRNDYVQIRKDSNDNFKRATTMATIIMFNHVISAIDAGLTTKFRNDRIKAELNMQGTLYHDEFVPMLALGVYW